ncbi:hypothetical protein PGTUg99_033772 [Puccinia graminis f. sp. tritici]|uniref:DUF7872 domain-containing protein n=1 Tax=Puccinia graminis f. sp. tritici TaxID=56615 RepID=A0A5B0RUN2_PUCGR|nr:hypothetical protein PGTUg99_033772 [Puccinia graminis f. sp. tritici]
MANRNKSSMRRRTLLSVLILMTTTTMSMIEEGEERVAHNRTYTLEKRGGGLNVMGALGAGTGFSGGGSKSLKDPCGYIELTPDNWQDLGIDEYLANYPNGDKLTLQEFAAELNVPNFYCGVGMQCSAGQLCSPAVGINWIILYAIQEWSNFMNSLYKAVEHAVTLVKDAASSIVSDFTSLIPPNDQLYGWTVADIVCGVLGSISAIAVPAFIPADSLQVAMADLAVAPAFLATPELGIGRDKDSPREGQKAYDAAGAALDARNYKAFDKIQTEKDEQVIQDFFHPPSSSLLTNGPPKAPSDPASKEPIFHVQMPESPRDNSHPHPDGSSPFVESPPPSPNGQPGSSPFAPNPPQSPRNPAPTGPDSTAPQNPKNDQQNPQTHQRQRRSLIKHKEGHSSSYAYTRYAYLESRLSSIQNRIQSYIAVNFKMATMAPILAKGGLAEILQGGAYLNPNPNENELQEGGKALAQITALAQLFQSLKIFVAIGSAECKAGGPNGAWNKKDELSYCTPDGLMMNIVQSSQTGLVIAMPNAHLLNEKYGYTTEFLARSAWECQKKYGIYTNSTAPPPVNMRSDCIFPLAVCDCTLPDVSKVFKGKNKNLIKACRDVANLPI